MFNSYVFIITKKYYKALLHYIIYMPPLWDKDFLKTINTRYKATQTKTNKWSQIKTNHITNGPYVKGSSKQLHLYTPTKSVNRWC